MANIRVTELDFDEIKYNLKQFLRAQDEFSDYDFEGSGLAVLIDMLAYNTHYNAYLANMLANEMFLDSAVKRESAVSIAKHLQYTPRSVIGATALVDITYASQPGTPSVATIDRYSSFTTTINGISYKFVNLEPLTTQPNNLGQYIFNNVTIKEGVPVTNIYTCVSPGPSEKYTILSDNVDVTTIRVRVQTAGSSTITVYTRAIDISGIVDATAVGGDATVFFVEENTTGKYEIFFGDGNIGKKIGAGDTVYIDYVVSNGSKVNVSTTLASSQIFTGPTLNGVTASVVTLESSNGAREKETIEEVKFNAPRANAAQNRLVTVDDYVSLIKRDVQNVKAVSVWGGEDNVPPVYGKVFLSVLPTSGNALTETNKQTILDDILGTKRVVAITPEFVDPDYFYVNITSSVKYDALKSTLTADQIRAKVVAKIQDYFETNLNTFNQGFLISHLTGSIDDADPNILGNQTAIKLQYRFVPSLKIANSKQITVDNYLHEGTLETTRFVYDNNGTLVQARIKDVPDAATVIKTGSYRRSGSLITCTFTTSHNLIVGETIYMTFTGGALPGDYKVYKVVSPTSLIVVSSVTGSASGTVEIQSRPRGSLVLYNPINQETLVNNVGFVNYLEGIIYIDSLFVKGFVQSATDIKISIGLVENYRDINVSRNQILRLDESAVNTSLNQLAGLTVTTIPIT